MRKLLITVMLFSTFLLTGWAFAKGAKSENQGVKERQKQELKALKLQHKYQKQAMKNSDMSKALRNQMKNQMKREERELRLKQKHELQELKDRQRVLKEAQGQY